MHAALRALLLALGPLLAASSVRAQPAELPPIFAPRPVAPAIAAPVVRPAVSGNGMSERMRALVTERILAGEKTFEAPVSAETAASAVTTETTSSGALLMRRFVVRSIAPSTDEVRPPDLPLYHFAPAGRVDRRTKGYTATLLRFFGDRGSVNLSVVNGAGNGIDHNIDFTRAEIGVSLRW